MTTSAPTAAAAVSPVGADPAAVVCRGQRFDSAATAGSSSVLDAAPPVSDSV